VAFPGYPPEPVLEMADATAVVLKRYGLQDVHLPMESSCPTRSPVVVQAVGRACSPV